MSGEVNAVAWVLWFVAVVTLPMTSRNPLYLCLLLLVVLAVFFSLPQRSGRTNPWRLFAYIGAGVSLLSIGFNVLTVHVGDRVFARLPDSLPIIGGPLTINALVYGVISATAIATVLFAAATFNTAVSHADLVRMLPGSLSRFGVAAGIALLFVPQTIAAGRDIYDAQRARGHHFRGVRSVPAFIVPLLSTGLERALLLSEALETRGFGASAVAMRPPRHATVLTVAAATCVVAALLAIGFGSYLPGMVALVAGGLLALYGSSGTVRRTRYRTMEWNPTSLLVSAASLLAMVVILFARSVIDLSFAYDTFPRIDAPGFAPLAGVAVLLLVAPAIVRHA